MLKNWVTETYFFFGSDSLDYGFNYMLKNWVTETREYKWVNSIMTAFQLYVTELSNWNIKVHSPRLKPLTFQLYVKELSTWNPVPGAAWFHSVAWELSNWNIYCIRGYAP